MNSKPKRVLILGAAGRDFHVFNTVFRDNPGYSVVAFTASQIPFISPRKYPAELAGKLYPKGIPILSEEKATEIIKKEGIELVVFAYSDVSHEYVMDRACRVMSLGPSFMLIGPKETMLESKLPVISVTAVRTGCGKSQTSRKISKLLRNMDKKVAIIRHPMPYGDLKAQASQCFERLSDLDRANVTIEEREEYESYLELGFRVFAGVDYQKVLNQAESYGDIILWDGGNNDFPFIKPNIEFCVVDPLRPGDELRYYPGELNLFRADIVVVNKVNASTKQQVAKLIANIRKLNNKAKLILANSEITPLNKLDISNKRVLAVEDGPSTTHGGLTIGAAKAYALNKKAILVDPRKYAIGTIKEVINSYPHINDFLPAVGYSKQQINELATVINKCDCDIVVSGTPMNLSHLIKTDKQILQLRYELVETRGSVKLSEVLKEFLENYTRGT